MLNTTSSCFVLSTNATHLFAFYKGCLDLMYIYILRSLCLSASEEESFLTILSVFVSACFKIIIVCICLACGRSICVIYSIA